jgi:hypothetical protein
MALVRCAAAILVLGAAGVADAQTFHELSAASSAHVEITQDGNVAMRARNARLVPYVLYDGDQNSARLATITTDVRTRTDAEGLDPASTVSFDVDDLSGLHPKRLSSFSAPGGVGAIVGERYGVATMPGCCGGADVHRVHALETGQALFRSTGDSPMGTNAWAEAPNAKPRTVRWAAFDGDISEKEAEAGLLGRISYGSDEGLLSSVELRTKTRNDDLALGLSHMAVLLWIDPKAGRANSATASGTADSPQQIWAIEGIADPTRIGGFRLELRLDSRRLMEIPIASDRLATTRARTTASITVSTATH